jgi:hypothetical protein
VIRLRKNGLASNSLADGRFAGSEVSIHAAVATSSAPYCDWSMPLYGSSC